MERKYGTGISIFTHNIQLQKDHTLDHTLGIFGWGCAAGTLEPLAYTRASSSEFCYPILDKLPKLW